MPVTIRCLSSRQSNVAKTFRSEPGFVSHYVQQIPTIERLLIRRRFLASDEGNFYQQNGNQFIIY